MTEHDWKPGGVAMLAFGGPTNHGPARRVEGGWRCLSDGFLHADSERLITDIRPLAVIDPEDREAVERLLDAFGTAEVKAHDGKLIECHSGSCWIGNMQAALREFAAPTPPRPSEPQGLGAVVECEHKVYEWARAILIGNGFAPWYYTDSSGNGGLRKWDDLAAVRVVSEGVTA